MAPEAAAGTQGEWVWGDGGEEGRLGGACSVRKHWLPGLGTQHSRKSFDSTQLPEPPPTPGMLVNAVQPGLRTTEMEGRK